MRTTRRPDVAPETFAALEPELRRHHSVGDVRAWYKASGDASQPVEVVVQDELTHDLIIPGGDSLFIVYATT